jgi:hypothetical protein
MTQTDIAALVADLTTKSAMINMGEKIAWGSETALMDQAVAALIAQDAELRRYRAALEFYADENRFGLPSDGPWGVGSNDWGKVARAALGEKP